MKKLGSVPIPADYSKELGKAATARQILEELTAENALLFEFDNKQDAHVMRTLVASMAHAKFGETGHVGSRIIENVLFIWLKPSKEDSYYAPEIQNLERAKHRVF